MDASLEIKFQSGFQGLEDMRSHKLAWIKIVHNAVLLPGFKWMQKTFKRAKPNGQPSLEVEISGHKFEQVSLTKWIVTAETL